MLQYANNQLIIEKTSCLELIKTYGTPLYVYSKNKIKDSFANYTNTFSASAPLICYAVKANNNLSILSYLASLGSGFDIVSGGELQKVLLAKGDVKKVIFSGVNKSEEEIRLALTTGILCFNIESLPEIDRIQKVAREMNIIAPISFRINPDVDAKTHPYISTGLQNNKFGIAYRDAIQAYTYAQKQSHLSIIGIDCHIGSQLLDLTPLCEAADKIFELVLQLKKVGIRIQHIDLGGGIGIAYQTDEQAPNYTSYAEHLVPFFQSNPDIKLIFEPGRSIIGRAGVLLTKVDFIKQSQHKNFILVDAAINDLLRPALYGSYHDIIPVRKDIEISPIIADVVGPICESSDCLGKDRVLATQENEYLAIKDVGAYGSSMASNYNSRLIIPEVLVNGNDYRLIKSKQTFTQMVQNEVAYL